MIYGAGAVGGVIGARLAEHGRSVVLIARGAHLEAIRAQGLTLETPNQRLTQRIAAVESPLELEPGDDDVVILAMKTQHTEAALEELAASKLASAPIVCAQNGVENERLVARRFPKPYGAAVLLPATHLAPGIIENYSATAVTGIIDVGRYPSGIDSTAAELCQALESSGFSSRADPSIMRKKYSKLLLNLGNAFEAACGAEGGGEILAAARSEALACYRAAGIDHASEEEESERRGDLIRLKRIAGRRRDGGSSWQSLARGSQNIEADYLNGEIVLLGALHGVPTPVNRTLARVANRMARTRAAPGSLGLDELKAEIERTALEARSER